MPSKALRTTVLALLISLAFVEVASAYYSPRLGRFLSRDPIGEPGAMLVRRVATTGFIPRDPSRESGVIVIPAAGARRSFIPRDRVSDPLGQLYHYVHNTPANRVDPLGLVDIVGCCPNQEEEIRAALERAKREIQSLIGSIDAAIKADTGDYPPFTALKLNKAKKYLNCANKALDNLRMKCECRKGLCKRSYAWVKWIFARTIHICPAFFDSVPSRYPRTKFQGATLVHEATHKCGTNDVHYFWQNGESPHDRGFGFFAFQDIASTYDTWILEGFCVPGYNCP